MLMIREAADAASRAYLSHWLKPILKTRHAAIKEARSPMVRRMRIAAQWADIESVMEQLRNIKS